MDFLLKLEYAVTLACWGAALWLFSRSFLSPFLRRKGLFRAAFFFTALTIYLFYGWAKTPLRSGYDNEHDFQYLSVSFFKAGSAHEVMSVKEASPLFTDAAVDLISGHSLKAVIWKNRALFLASVWLLFSALLLCGLGLDSALAGAGLLGFNFLGLLNSNSFSTTSANLFIFTLALYALAPFLNEESRTEESRGAQGAGRRLGLLACGWLLLTARYELFIALCAICVPLLACGRLKGLYARKSAWPALLVFLTLCAAWGIRLCLTNAYNGPTLFTPFRNFAYQLGARNLGMVMPFFSGAVLSLAAGAFTLILCAAFLEKGRRSFYFGAAASLFAWLAFFSIIFIPIDLYPLHFMRHQLYFFVPCAILGAFAWEAGTGLARTGASRLFFLVLCAGLAVYAFFNFRCAVSLNGELRTNDREWQLLEEARGKWPPNTALVYPEGDNRSALFEKYFPLLDGCGGPPGQKFIKYLPPSAFIFKKKAVICSDSYSPGENNYMPAGSRPWLERTFSHRFYTMWDDETRKPVVLRFGFYHADSGADKAWIFERKASCLIRAGLNKEARSILQEAVKADPDCGPCRYGLAAASLFSGRTTAAEELGAAFKLDPSCAGTHYVKAFLSILNGDNVAADRELDAMMSQKLERRAYELAADLKFGFVAAGGSGTLSRKGYGPAAK
ncbi:MAG TPA: hypothetical protein DCL44_02715 [Elusimicrobia bacterium]|nr:hypothetical protein [Elusimicrobiota bacterium]